MTVIRTRVVRDQGFAHEIVTLVTESGPLLPLIRYQLTKLSRSLSWHRELLRAVFLLLDFSKANPLLCENPRDLFRTFSWRLLVGTIDDQGRDMSGLYWRPLRAGYARRITETLSAFSDNLATDTESTNLNPMRSANFNERILNMAAWAHRNNESFLGHLESRSAAWAKAGHVRSITMPYAPSVTAPQVKAFPEKSFRDLIFTGFAVNPNTTDSTIRLNIRDVLVTLLLHGGGVRVSEAFNLWIQDVTAVDGSALVRIGHPTEDFVRWHDSDGVICKTSRAEYLMRHGLRPRNLTNGPLHAGWKNPTLDRKWHLEVHWSDPEYGQFFLKLWKIYLMQIASLPRAHPWAWVSMQADSAGQPLKISRYNKSHEQAVRRINLKSDSDTGTSPQSHRHAYANRLAKMGVSPKAIKQCLHHNSLASQVVYTQSTLDEVNRELVRGYAAMKRDAGHSLSSAWELE